MLTTQKQIRALFWQNNPDLDQRARAMRTRSKSQNHQDCDTRMAFCDFVDTLAKCSAISAELADRAAL